MKDTAIALSSESKARFVAGHDDKLKTVPGWDIPTLAGAGALGSTANDMRTFESAFLGFTKTPLATAMSVMTEKHQPTGTPGMEIGLAWHMFVHGDDMVVWHDGGTGGYRPAGAIQYLQRPDWLRYSQEPQRRRVPLDRTR
jgi:hypothetical protein